MSPESMHEAFAGHAKYVREFVQNEIEREYHIACVDKEGHAVTFPEGSKVWIVRTDPTMPRILWEAGLAALSAYSQKLEEVLPGIASDIRKHVELQKVACEAFDRDRKILDATPDAVVTTPEGE